MAKKRWISAFHSEPQKHNINTEQISWDSSSSEDEYSKSSKEERRSLSEVNCTNSPVITFQKNNALLTRKDDTGIVESPIVGLRRLELYKLSPELPQRRASSLVKEHSPIIQRRRVRLQNNRHKSKENSINSCLSPELFDVNPTQNITYDSQPIHSPLFSEFSSQATMIIEPFPSQLSSQVKQTDIEMKTVSLYYEPPKRRKNYKRGGLACQMDKALKTKKSRVKIWHHEKINNIEGGFKYEADVIRFQLKKVWNEYGNSLLLCETTNESVALSSTGKKGMENSLGSGSSNNKFLLNLGASTILSTKWKNENIYQLFPPYDVDRVQYCGEDVIYYSNASKVMTCKSTRKTLPI